MFPASSTYSTPLAGNSHHPMDSSRLMHPLLELAETVNRKTPPTPFSNIINISVLRRFLSAICYRDTETLKHSRRVGLLSVGIGTRLGWEEDELRLIEIAALLHDVGKIGVPDHILFKPGRLSPDEAEHIASYHRVMIELLQACHANRELLTIISQSHGLEWKTNQTREKETLLGSRILAVADAFEALTSNKVYRSAYTHNEALNKLHDQSGKMFDRNVVAALERWLKSDEAGALTDEKAADSAVVANFPTTDSDRIRAASLSNLFQYIHLLESLYEAFYVVSEDRKVLLWNMGASSLFGFQASDLIGHPWHRSVVASTTQKHDPIDLVFAEQIPICHSLNLKDIHGNAREFGVQSTPICDEEGYVVAVAEFLCDNNESKRNQGQFRQLQMAATRDALTGVVNRGELDEQLNQVHEKWEAEPTLPYSIVFLDIDHFKSINDRYSHAVGDRVLIDVARLVQDELYSGEVIGRYGGEEFVILCPETPLETALDRAERLRRTVAETTIAGREGIRVTASFGVTQVEHGDTPETALKRADEALYQAKNSGRNKTCHLVLRKKKEKSSNNSSEPENVWVHQVEIITCVANSMLPIKLKGFVQDNQAKLIDVKEKELVVHVGASALLGGWGNRPEKQPVKVHIEITELPRNEKVAGTKRLLLKTTTEPIGRPSKHETFQSRAIHVTEALRSYLIAD